ncbi:hypothetical protein ACFE04_000165 [Oxalis oulophora]
MADWSFTGGYNRRNKDGDFEEEDVWSVMERDHDDDDGVKITKDPFAWHFGNNNNTTNTSPQNISIVANGGGNNKMVQQQQSSAPSFIISERRQAEAGRIREKYSDRIPVIVEKAERSDVPDIDKKKYLVPSDLTVGQFVYVVRKRIKLSAEKAIFVFVKNTLPPTAALMSAIYEENKDEDGFLYMTYSGENTFGSL